MLVEEIVAIDDTTVGREPCITGTIGLYALHVAMQVKPAIITAHVLQRLSAIGGAIQLDYAHEQFLRICGRGSANEVVIALTAVLVNGFHLLHGVGYAKRRTSIGTFIEQWRTAEVQGTWLREMVPATCPHVDIVCSTGSLAEANTGTDQRLAVQLKHIPRCTAVFTLEELYRIFLLNGHIAHLRIVARESYVKHQSAHYPLPGVSAIGGAPQLCTVTKHYHVVVCGMKLPNTTTSIG